MLKDFYRETTKKFDLQISYNGTYPDITSDTVTLYIANQKADTDAEFVLTQSADVTSSGATGIAKFNLTPTLTDITAGTYDYEIRWDLQSGEKYVLLQSNVAVLESVKD